jgi:hypothetical protein
VSKPMMFSTEDELVAAALALVEAQKGLEQVKVRQAAVLERLTAKQPESLEPAPVGPSAATELRKAEDKIAAARARLERAVEAHVDALRDRPTTP